MTNRKETLPKRYFAIPALLFVLAVPLLAQNDPFPLTAEVV